MFTSQILRARYFVILVLLVIVGASVYAFAAANVVPESGAGIGSDTISGYTVANVTYNTNTDSDPTTLDDVTFDLTATAGADTATEVFAQVEPGGTWFTCTAGVGNSWSCNITATDTVSATMLNVVAAQ